jgi:uncharacterized membrane protein
MMFGERMRWVTTALGISLLLNLFLAGVVVGRWTFPGLPKANLSEALVTPQEIRALPYSERSAFSDIILARAPAIKTAYEKVRAAKHSAEEAIAAPRYNRAVLEAKFSDVRRATLALQTLAHEAVIEALGKINAQSRASIAHQAEANAASAR